MYGLRERSPEFRAMCDTALDEAADVLEKEMWRRAVKGTRKPVYQGGALVGHVQEYSDTLLIFALKGARPEKFRERVDVKTNAPAALADAITAAAELARTRAADQKEQQG